MFLLAKEKFNQKPTTAKERQAFRDETISALAQRGVAIPKKPTKSFKRLLRQEIPKRRAAIADQEMSRKRQEAGWADQKTHQALSDEVDRHEQRIFGGYSRDDNPQTRARAAEFAKEKRRTELERKNSPELRDEIFNLIYFSAGNTLRSRDLELHWKLRDMYNDIPILESIPLTLRKKNEAIEAILKAETIINNGD